MQLGPGSGGGGREGRVKIGVGHVKVWGIEPGVAYILPLDRGGSQVGGRAQRGPNVKTEGSLPGIRALGEGGGVGWGGGISSVGASRRGEEEGLRGGRACREPEQAGAVLPSQLSWAQPHPFLSSAPAPGEQR